MVKIELLSIKESIRKNKRLVARFKFTSPGYDPQYRNVHFGQKHGRTYTDHLNEMKKENWLKRHRYSIERAGYIPWSPAVLSKMILWNKPTIRESIDDYRKEYGF